MYTYVCDVMETSSFHHTYQCTWNL